MHPRCHKVIEGLESRNMDTGGFDYGIRHSAAVLSKLIRNSYQVPVFFLTSLVLGLVIFRSFRDSPSSSPEFNFTNGDVRTLATAYYVDMDATALLTISSWSSTLTPLLGLVLMELWSYRIAKKIHAFSQFDAKDELPSPYQLVMLLETLKG